MITFDSSRIARPGSSVSRRGATVVDVDQATATSFCAPPKPPAGPRPPGQPAILSTEEAAFLTQINNYRTAAGLGRLKVSNALTEAARFHSQKMAEHMVLQHDSFPPCNPCDAIGRIRSFYNYRTYIAENIAMGQTTGVQVFEGWSHSPIHNVNMLCPSCLVIGISQVRASDGNWYWTTDFGGFDDASEAVPEHVVPPLQGTINPYTRIQAAVRSNDGRPLPRDLSVTLNGRLMFSETTQMGAQIFNLGNLSAGAYTLVATGTGFRRWEYYPVRAVTGQTVSVEVILEPVSAEVVCPPSPLIWSSKQDRVDWIAAHEGCSAMPLNSPLPIQNSIPDSPGPAQTSGTMLATFLTLGVVGGLFLWVTSGPGMAPTPRTNPFDRLKYSERKGWTGANERTLYHVTDTLTGNESVRDGHGLKSVGPNVTIRLASRAEADAEGWPAGWTVADDASRGT